MNQTTLAANTGFELYPHQIEALDKLSSGAILYGDVGSGKTLTSLAFYIKTCPERKLYIITTAKKRDSGDWEEEAAMLGIQRIVVDSWNNIQKYKSNRNAFFIFDEQRVVGYQAWSKAFIFIAKNNQWILLSGTPGDVWSDYIPVFCANGFYRNKTDFIEQHVEYDRFSKYPKIKAYHNEGKLMKLRRKILVPMKIVRKTTRNRKHVKTEFDKKMYKEVMANRWNVFTESPIQNASEYTQVLRQLVATHYDRVWHAKWIMDVHDKIIVFYNYNYELDILMNVCNELGKPHAQWNGKKHEPIPETDDWIYLVQYTAGAEGWNCTETNVMLFYSLNYSYRIMEQAEGRIDRINTKFTKLEYFYLTSTSSIDNSVRKAIESKKRFNESVWATRRNLPF